MFVWAMVISQMYMGHINVTDKDASIMKHILETNNLTNLVRHDELLKVDRS